MSFAYDIISILGLAKFRFFKEEFLVNYNIVACKIYLSAEEVNKSFLLVSDKKIIKCYCYSVLR